MPEPLPKGPRLGGEEGLLRCVLRCHIEGAPPRLMVSSQTFSGDHPSVDRACLTSPELSLERMKGHVAVLGFPVSLVETVRATRGQEQEVVGAGSAWADPLPTNPAHAKIVVVDADHRPCPANRLGKRALRRFKHNLARRVNAGLADGTANWPVPPP